MSAHHLRRQGMTLADYVTELVDEHQHVERWTERVGSSWVDRQHRTRAPGLLDQLWANDAPSNATKDDPRPAFGSKPAARLDALDTAVRIDLEAARWVRDLGEDDHHVSTAATVRQLHALAASAAPEQRRAIEHDVRDWWVQARIVTGWDAPAWTPDATCPQCGERGSLRVRLAEHIAMCKQDVCRATWDPTTIGILADHIREESEADKPDRTTAGPCWCPVPKPVVADLSQLCSGCGSARCRHALGARLLDTLRERGA